MLVNSSTVGAVVSQVQDQKDKDVSVDSAPTKSVSEPCMDKINLLDTTGDADGESEFTDVEIIDEPRDKKSSSFAPLHVDVGRIHVQSWHVPLMVGRRNVFGLLDSGAQVTVVRPEVLLDLPKEYRKVTPTPLQIVDVHGRSSEVQGIAKIPIQIGSKTIMTDVVVSPMYDVVLLGMNFFDKVQASLNFGAGILTMGNEQIVLSREGASVASARMTTRRTVVVPAGSEMVVPIQPYRKTLELGKPYMMQPLATFSPRTGLVMGRTLTKCDQDGAKVLVVNTSDTAISVMKGTFVAFASPVDSVYGAVSVKPEPSDEIPDYGSVIEKMPKHLRGLVEDTDLCESDKLLCAQLVTEYADTFLKPDGPLGRTEATTHKIFTGDNAPIKQKHRRIPIGQQGIIDDELERMLRLGVIEPSESPWRSQVVLSRKKNGQIRFCVDYRCVNLVTRKDCYPLPNILETFDRLSGAKYFSTLDLASGYWQIAMKQEDREKTAFAAKQGLYQFTVMPFGLCNAPATFERLMDKILHGYLWERCMCYLDDIIIYGHTFPQALENLRAVFERIRASGLKLQPKKCELFRTELLYLGFVVNGDGVKPDPTKLDAIRKWAVPCSVHDVRSFLGFANYHRRFVKNYAVIAEPLLVTTRGKQSFIWGPEQQQAFERLKEALLAIPTLNHPKTGVEYEFVLDTDASAYALGGALYQRIDGVEYPIGFASKTLSRAQRNYCTTYRELLAIVEMVKHFRHYLLGQKFILRTDHSSLRWLRNYQDISGMLARWLSRLEEYTYEVQFRKGSEHVNADALSRCHSCKNEQCPGNLRIPTSESDTSDGDIPVRPVKGKTRTTRKPGRIESVGWETNETTASIPLRRLSHRQQAKIRTLNTQLTDQNWLSDFSHKDLIAAQQIDAVTGKVYEWIQTDKRPDSRELAKLCEETKNLVARWKQLSIRDGILVRQIYDCVTGKEVYQTVLPSVLRQSVLHQLHDLRLVGHLGIQRTVQRVKQRFYWPGITLDVTRWCAKCNVCASRKGKPNPRRAPLTQLPTGAPFDRIALDILDTHKPTSKGYRYILVISDYFTKYTDAFPLRRHTAKAVAQILLHRWIFYHAVPKAIHSDQGKEFESAIFRNLTTLLQAEKIRTTPYRPQSDGQVERMNRTILGMLSAFVSERGTDWDTYLPYVMMAYRTSVHASTGCTPQLMVYGREANLPIDLVYSPTNPPDLPACGPEYVEFIRDAIRTAHEFARDHLHQAAVRQKKGYDAHAKNNAKFEVGDLVRYYYVPLTQGNKFARPWTGPWKVLSRETEVDYKIALVSNPRKTRVIHVDVLKEYEGAQVVTTEESSSDRGDTAVHDEFIEDTSARDNPGMNTRSRRHIQRNARTTDDTTTDESSSGVITNPADVLPRRETIHGLSPPPTRPQRSRRKPRRYGFTDDENE